MCPMAPEKNRVDERELRIPGATAQGQLFQYELTVLDLPRKQRLAFASYHSPAPVEAELQVPVQADVGHRRVEEQTLKSRGYILQSTFHG